MSTKLIGRLEEQAILAEALRTDRSEMIAVIGRRRVGKTFLIRQFYEKEIVFELVGLQSTIKKEQLRNFSQRLQKYSQSTVPVKVPSDWLEAFFILSAYLDSKPSTKKRVIFLDELPWLALNKSGFLTGLGWFWNSWAENRNVIVVLCGSAASWMIQKVVNDKGGLHNRITRSIFLQPFTLRETELYLKSIHLTYNRYQILQLYMALGGIPHYLMEVKKGKSVVQNINDICFANNGMLREEFDRLFEAIFSNAHNHIAVIRSLAQSRQGLTRTDIINAAELVEGGNTSKVLLELEQSGFIASYQPFDKLKKDTLYRLTDEYSLFYLRFIENCKQSGPDTWNQLSQSQTAKIWMGYAFENACLKHVDNIKKAMGIASVYTKASTFLARGNEESKGAQIDLVLDRNDQTINLFEIKYYNTELSLDEADAKVLRQKLRIFSDKTKTRKHVTIALITTFGLEHNKHSLDLVENALNMDDLY